MSLNKNCFLFIQVMYVEKMDTKTSPVSPKCRRGSSFVVGNFFVLVLVNPSAATPFFSPARAALFGLVVYKPRGRRVAKPKICRKVSLLKGNAPFPLVSPDLSAMASPTLVTDPLDVARRVVESNLRVVWHGSQRVSLSVCMYVCM
jgi:hypothetical protein